MILLANMSPNIGGAIFLFQLFSECVTNTNLIDLPKILGFYKNLLNEIKCFEASSRVVKLLTKYRTDETNIKLKLKEIFLDNLPYII